MGILGNLDFSSRSNTLLHFDLIRLLERKEAPTQDGLNRKIKTFYTLVVLTIACMQN